MKESRWKRSDGKAMVEPTRPNDSKASQTGSALAALKKAADVGPQLNATTPVIEKRSPGANPLNLITTFDSAFQENSTVQYSSVVTQSLFTANAKASTTFHALATNFAFNRVGVNLSAFQARANPTTCNSSISSMFPMVLSTSTGVFARDPTTTTGVEEFTTTEVLTSFATVVRPWTINPGPIGLVTSVHPSFRTATSTSFQTFTSTNFQTFTSMGQQTFTSDQGTGLTGPALNGGPSASQTKAIAGGVAGATVIVILGLIVFCVLGRKRRYRAARSASTHELPTSAVPGQRMRQSRLITTTQPFLEFPATQDHSPKGTIIHRAGSILARKNRGDSEQAVGDIEQAAGDVEPAIDPLRDPIPEGGCSNDGDENQRVSNALVRLQAFTNRFEGEFQQLCVLAQSGQLSAQDCLKLEEIRHTTGLDRGECLSRVQPNMFPKGQGPIKIEAKVPPIGSWA